MCCAVFIVESQMFQMVRYKLDVSLSNCLTACICKVIDTAIEKNILCHYKIILCRYTCIWVNIDACTGSL